MFKTHCSECDAQHRQQRWTQESMRHIFVVSTSYFVSIFIFKPQRVKGCSFGTMDGFGTNESANFMVKIFLQDKGKTLLL